MAEAAVEQRPNRYYCHQCLVEINPTLPDFTCPRCESGFIEMMTEEMTDNFQGEENWSDPAAHFAELWGRTFLENFRLNSTQDENISEEEEEFVDVRPPRRIGMTRVMLGRPRSGDDRQRALPSLIEHLLQSLTGTRGNGQIPLGHVTNLHGNPADYAWGTGGLDNIITQLLSELEGTGPPPAQKDEIESLKTVKITEQQVDKNTQCSVCMEDFKLDEDAKCLPCLHHYHIDCIVPWLELHGTCPICRKTLKGEDTTVIPQAAALESSSNRQNMDTSSGSRSQRSSSSRDGTSPTTSYGMLDCDEFD